MSFAITTAGYPRGAVFPRPRRTARAAGHGNRNWQDLHRYSPDLYFATYQAFDSDYPGSESTDGSSALLDYPADFFDLTIVDECHR